MKNNYWVVSIAGLFILFLFWFALQEIGTAITPAPTSTSSEGAVLLSFGKFNYNPDTITAKVGEPLRIKADLKRITGCYRSFRVPALGVSEYFSANKDTIEFTPQKTGTFLFTCNMGMGRGTLIVT